MVDTISPRTRAWAISAVILGILTLIMTSAGLVIGMLHLSKGPTPTGSAHTLGQLISLLSCLTAVGFIAGGAGVMKQKTWGRETLLYAGLSAIVLAVLSAVLQWSAFHDPDTIKLMSDQFAKMPQLSAMPQAQRDQMIKMQMNAGIGVVAFIAAIQIAYCIPLCIHMASKQPAPVASETP